MGRYLKSSLPFVFIILTLICIPACDIFDETNPIPKPEKTKGVIFTNAADPRFAEVETEDGRKVTFFGTRNPDGSPKRLIGYKVQALNEFDSLSADADYVTFDSEGRYSNIFLKTGESMHLDYLLNDSIAITLSSINGTSDVITIKGDAGTSNGRIEQDSKDNNRIAKNNGGIDGHVNIKVTGKNKTTQKERNITDKETAVEAHIIAGPNHNYKFLVPYNTDKGVFSFDIRSTGLIYDDFSKYVNVIGESIIKACSMTGAGGISAPGTIAKAICRHAPYNPVAFALCAAATTVFVGCEVVDKLSGIDNTFNVMENLRKILKKIDSNFERPTDATVSIHSRHFKYSKQDADQITLSQVIANLSSTPDIEIVHEYIPELSLTVVSGYVQSGVTLEILAQPLIVKVIDSEGEPYPNVNVLFNVTSGGGKVEKASVSTDANGIAQTRMRAGDFVGVQKVKVIAKDSEGNLITGSPVEFTAIVSKNPDPYAGWCRFEVPLLNPYTPGTKIVPELITAPPGSGSENGLEWGEPINLGTRIRCDGREFSDYTHIECLIKRGYKYSVTQHDSECDDTWENRQVTVSERLIGIYECPDEF